MEHKDFFDLSMDYFFSSEKDEEWNERMAYVLSLDTDSDFMGNSKSIGEIFFSGKNNCKPDFLCDGSEYTVFDLEHFDEITAMNFPESKIGRNIARIYGDSGDHCGCCGVAKIAFFRDITYGLCDECDKDNEEVLDKTPMIL